MATAPLSAPAHREGRSLDWAALALVLAGHVGLVGALTLFARQPAPIPPPPRVTVTLTSEAALQPTSPEPAARAAPELAPTLGEPAEAPKAEPVPEPPKPEPLPEPPKPEPVVPKPARPKPVPPKPVPPKPAPPKPVAARAVPAKSAPPKPVAPAAKPAPAKPTPAKLAAARPVAKPAAPRLPAPGDERPRRRPDKTVGASAIGAGFLEGIPSPDRQGTAKTPPAPAIGPGVKASLAGAIAGQLKPHWAAPQGADAEKLVTVLAFDLNPDGSLASAPRVVSQDGITDANRPQAARHAEQAMRAVRLAAPFGLPSQYYAAWKRVAAFRFDRKLSQ